MTERRGPRCKSKCKKAPVPGKRFCSQHQADLDRIRDSFREDERRLSKWQHPPK